MDDRSRLPTVLIRRRVDLDCPPIRDTSQEDCLVWNGLPRTGITDSPTSTGLASMTNTSSRRNHCTVGRRLSPPTRLRSWSSGPDQGYMVLTDPFEVLPAGLELPQNPMDRPGPHVPLHWWVCQSNGCAPKVRKREPNSIVKRRSNKTIITDRKYDKRIT